MSVLCQKRTLAIAQEEDPKYRQKAHKAQTTQLLNLIASLVDGIAASRAFAGRSREKP
jgi:hypothetical protein